MKHPLQTILWMVMVLTLASACPAPASSPITETLLPGLSDPGSIPSTAPAPVSVAEHKKNFHIEMGGNYSFLNNNYGSWKAIDMSLMYSGFERITPFGSISSLHRKEGSQLVYGAGSYINVNPSFYMIAGVSGAPVRDPNVVYYPRLRMDLMGLYKAPMADGLVLTAGFTDFSMEGGGGANIISLGSLYYYKKAIFSGSLNYNIARPGSVTSLSGQVGIMYGTQGKYWFGGGGVIGEVAYQPASEASKVRFDSRGVNVFYQRWIGKNWGIISRYDYQDLVDAYQLHGISMKLFIDF
jgi:YaiO family outer membrane protein